MGNDGQIRESYVEGRGLHPQLEWWLGRWVHLMPCLLILRQFRNVVLEENETRVCF